MDKIKRLWSFDQLIGPPLVAIIYYVGLAGIVGALLLQIVLALMALASNFGQGAMMLIGGVAVGAVVIVLWRFVCEVCMVTFQNHALLLDIRERQDAQYPEF